MRFEARQDGDIWEVWHVATNRLCCSDLTQTKAKRLARRLNAAWLYQDITAADFDTALYQEFIDTISPIIKEAQS